MHQPSSVSIIICTHNRAENLKRTLNTLRGLNLSPSLKTEIVIVDNGSTDTTEATVRAAKESNSFLEYVFEPKAGLSNARNAGLARARGDYILFTDDDVLVEENWVKEMVIAIGENDMAVVTGRIRPAEYLVRPWMKYMHRVALALNDVPQIKGGSVEIYGANMGFHRSALARVPLFDPEIGAGALGYGEETLFAWQLLEAGFKIVYAPKAQVVHHFDVSRLRRKSFLNGSKNHGRSMAYLRYHWQHNDLSAPFLTAMSYWTRLQIRRKIENLPAIDAEGCPEWEMSYVAKIAMCKQFLRERRRSRQYSRFSLKKGT
jgi:glycosyltransferase involved in cell wall biosynthesis